MIRVNLANATSVSTGQTQINVSAGAVSALGSGLQNNPAAKIAAIFIIPIILFIYEKQNLSAKAEQLKAAKAKLQKIEAEVSKFGSVTKAVEQVRDERNKLQNRLVVIEKISRKRAVKIETLSALQNIMPGDGWITQIEINKTNIAIEGYARTPSSVQVLVERLGNLPHIVSADNEGVERIKLGDANLHKFVVGAVAKESW